MHIRAATHPLKVGRVDACVGEGMTLAEMLEHVQPDPILRRNVHIYVGAHYVPPQKWHRVRPKAGTTVSIRAYIGPHGGGGGGGGKNILRIVLMIAVIALAFAAPYLLPLVGLAPTTTIIGGLTLGTLTTAVVGAVGMLLVNAIVPARPPQQEQLSGAGASARSSPTLFIEGARNQARPFGVVPTVLGRHRMVPPLGARPYTEVVGDQHYLRMLFVWGVGPLSLSDFKIGETAIADFDDIEIEHREGYDDDADITLYPAVVDQDDSSVHLTVAAGAQIRTTTPDADEVSVDITFPNGIISVNPEGQRGNRSVTLQMEYRPTGTVDWLPIPVAGGARTFPDSWLDDPDDFTEITFTHARDSAIRHGITFRPPARGQFDVRLIRTGHEEGMEFAEDKPGVFDVMFWSALRRITNGNPINSPVPLAMTALRIRATDQLNGVIDEFNGVVESVALDYDPMTPGGNWVERTTRNPASLFRHVLQCNATQAPMADARIDLDNLADFHDHCTDNGYEFNQVRDFSSSIWDTLADVAAAGHATPTQIDGKWGVIIDRTQAIPVSHVTPRNSWEFSASKLFADLPHGFRVRFPNEDQGWRQDERIIYFDGYTSANATKFETIELPGLTHPDLVWKHGRFHAAAAVLRPERWMFKQQMEHLAYRRGDRILVTHDVLLVGTASGRIKAIETDTSGDVTGLTLDEAVVMEAGTDYGISIRTVTNAEVTARVSTVAGTSRDIVLVTAIPAASAPAVGDLFGFGEYGSETDDALVFSIEPETDNIAQVSVIPYRAGVYTADTGDIPPFETTLTPRESIPAPVVLSARSDETVLVYGPGESLQVRIAVEVESLADTSGVNDLTGILDVQMRPAASGEPFYNAVVERATPEEVLITGVRQGETWDIRVRWRLSSRLPGPWTTLFNHVVVGKSTAPAALEGLTISAFGGQAMMRWNRPDELDVIFGGEVRFRHSPVFSGAEWSDSASIGEVARARDLVASLPLKPGTYLARVFDTEGNPSDIATVTTKQASVLTFANVDTIDEAPTFSGLHIDTVTAGDGILKLIALGEIDDVSDIDDLSDIDSYGGIEEDGEYYFAAGFDFLTVKKVRLTTRVEVVVTNTLDFFDERAGNIDDWEDFDGTNSGSADIKVYVRHTDDDPDTSGANWSAWERLDSAEFEARGFEFYAVLTTDDESYNIFVSELGVDAEEVT